MNCRYTAYGFGTSLSEYHSSVWSDVLWVFDESEPAGSLVSCSKVISVHGYDGGSLSGATTMH